jgi:hypothetical protein
LTNWSEERLREMAEAEDEAGGISIGSFDEVMAKLALEQEVAQLMTLSYPTKAITDGPEIHAWNPDLPGCEVWAPSLEEAIDKLAHKREQWITERVSQGLVVPKPHRPKAYVRAGTTLGGRPPEGQTN